MNAETTTGPLFKNVNELHEDLVRYAQQALNQTEAIVMAPGFDGSKRTFADVFASEAKERFAQIAMSLWLERERDLEEARGLKIEIDGKPLSSIEEAIYASAFVAQCTSLRVQVVTDLPIIRSAPMLSRNPSPAGPGASCATIACDDAIRAVRWYRAAVGR